LNVKCHKYIYFMQALETRFGLNEGNFDAAINAAYTYVLGIPTVTNASWMQNLIATHTNSKTWLVRPGIEKSIFRNVSSRKNHDFTVLVEGNASTQAKIVPQSLEVCALAKVPRLIHVSPVPRRKSKAYEVYSKVPYIEMPRYYSQTDVLLKLTRSEGVFGPPIEAFHCGATSIVSKVTGYDEYIVDGVNGMVIDVDDFERARELLLELQTNNELLQSLKKGAAITASNWPSIHESGQVFSKICSLVLDSSRTHINRVNAIKQLQNAIKSFKVNPDEVSWAIK